jgi:hypothetical protein
VAILYTINQYSSVVVMHNSSVQSIRSVLQSQARVPAGYRWTAAWAAAFLPPSCMILLNKVFQVGHRVRPGVTAANRCAGTCLVVW